MTQTNKSSGPCCSFCGKELAISVLKSIPKNGAAYNISECAECRIAMTHPFPSDEELTRLYSRGNYRTDTGKRFGSLIESLIHFGRILKRRSIHDFVKPGRILDIGCGRGLFLDVMRRGGWSVIGTELNAGTASYAVKVYGLEILDGDVTQHQLPAESMDAININQVLEHLKNPGEVLTECRRLLRKDGLLIISVPDLRSPQFTIGKENWFLLDIPFHLFHFTEEGLSSLLRKNGFSIRRVKRFNLEYSPFGWLQTLLNISNIRFNLLYDLLKSRELRGSEMEPIKPGGIIATLLLLPIYFPLSMVLSVLEPLLWKRGGSIEVYAVKE
ncbi:MAG: class I SAM-dependent methyltransferase [Nitrospinae bacterium]|nr:class I SAM-dependent methyltransferase [Nitrospinota bacterium]